MKKIIKLTEADLTRIVKRVISEQDDSKFRRRDNEIQRILNKVTDDPENDPNYFSDEFEYADNMISFAVSKLLRKPENENVDEDELFEYMKENYSEGLFDIYRSEAGDEFDDDDFDDFDDELDESLRGNYRIRNWGPNTWHDEDDRAVNPDDIEDYEEEVEFGPDEYDRFIEYTKDIPNKWDFKSERGYYDKHYKPGREIPIKIRRLRQK